MAKKGNYGGTQSETVKTGRGSFTMKTGYAKDCGDHAASGKMTGDMPVKASGAAGGYKGSTGGDGVR